ncbi:uncharacterized protein SPPG_05984 [Spizellomyces punctatus DAOM BR117]|uniref:Uncharacterized protein n=1 Tax=Spizellomyces punctatus (strain DAOM BR117) TaxID=645134 RepID=A0A0L0HDI5_SPIPD|nr:uncharacterized protein SPPG_05984 [Spizellomyces punctatus DAOM BR117]KNC99034.1 hypothetical protein SPPG_05984 [Spizellomyces punctatus DAOM BR117]|eukprot:XP_016607074.1 hypothetical protein SPPG_05984 [Spizellomyces punctatus DAOM BR117]
MAWNWNTFDWDNTTHRFFALCYLADMIVWLYRIATRFQLFPKSEPYPFIRKKFATTLLRTIVLVLHIGSGVTEIALGFAAFFTGNEILAKIITVAALAFHVPTAIYMTPFVYGARRLMRPAYMVIIFFHAYCAVNLWLNPTSTEWIVSTISVLHTYIWVRIFYFIFAKTQTLPSGPYTLSVVFAGYVTLPYFPRNVAKYSTDLLVTTFTLSYVTVEFLVYKHILKYSGKKLVSTEFDIDDADHELVIKYETRRNDKHDVITIETITVK